MGLGLDSLVTVGLMATAAEAATSRYVPLFKNDALPKNVTRQIRAAGGNVVRTIPQIGLAVATSDSPSFAGTMGRLASVAGVGEGVIETLPETENADLAEDGPTAADDLFSAGLVWSGALNGRTLRRRGRPGIPLRTTRS